MTRRLNALLIALALSLSLGPLSPAAGPPGKVWQVGYLSPTPPPPYRGAINTLEAMRQGLRELGDVEGHSLALELRWADNHLDRLPALAAELVQRQVDVIVTIGSPPARAAKQVTTTIPVVMSGIPDPVGSGVIASLARPGGNLTGVALTPGAMLHSKALQLFKEAVPTLSRVAVLWGGEAPRVFTDVLQQATQALGLTWLPFTVWSSQEMPALLHDFRRAFTAIIEAHADGLVVFGNPATVHYEELILEFAAAHRLPTLFHGAASVRAGGLMSYYPDLTHIRHRTAVYVDKILRGAKPADLPVEQPMKFELVINLKTAQALGLTLPPTLLFQATEVIR